MLNDKASNIATPFFKQLIINESSEDFLLDKDRCLEFLKFMKDKKVEAKDFRKIKINVFLQEYREINKYYPCVLIKENSSWISVDESGEYRYFSRKPNGKVFIFDILDLFQIGHKIHYRELAIWLKDELGIILQDKFFSEESDKYLENVKFISQNDFLNSKIKQISKDKEDIYLELNQIGLENLFSKTLTLKGDAMFFASTSYIKQRLSNKYSHSTIVKVINTFSVIGMINKIREEDIPIEFREGNKRKVQNFTSYYSIPRAQDVFASAEQKAELLANNNVSYYNLTKKRVIDVLGKDVYSETYVQKTYEGKQHTQTDKVNLLDIFFSIFKENKYVSKELFYENAPKGFSKSFLDKEFDNIVKCNGFRSVRPNNRLKKKLGLKGNSNIAIK